MPSYRAINKKSKKEKHFSTDTIQEMLDWEKDNPGWEVVPENPPILGYNVYRVKPDEGFRDLLREKKKKFPKNTIDIK